MILALSGALALAADRDLTWYVVPNAAFDTDDGFGAGARAEVAWLEEGYAPYKLSLVAQGYVATSGFQHHRFRLDRTGIGRHHRGRATLHLAWRQWLNDGYYGIGNGTTRDRAFLGTFDADDPDRKRYRYKLFQPFAHLTLRHALKPSGPVQVFVALAPKVSVVETWPGSLLEEEQPYGMAGGPAVQAYAGVLHDTREPEVAPVHGHLLEASVRATPDLGGEAGGFGGGLLSARAFAGAEALVLAGRVMGEWLVGTVPFYEMVHWGGAIPVQGMGGFESIRGLTIGRLRAPGKALVNLELRWRLATLAVGDAPLGLELAPYLDAGTVWGAEVPVPTYFPVHPAAGLGGRVIFDETFVGRLDTGFGLDPVLEEDGSVTQEPTWGFYLTFDHAF